MKRGLWLLAAVLVLLTIAACAPKAAPIVAPAHSTPPQSAAPSAPTAPIPAKATWEEELEKTSEAARREGRLFLVLTAGGELRSAIVQGFRESYGIKVEAISGKGAEIATKLLAGAGRGFTPLMSTWAVPHK